MVLSTVNRPPSTYHSYNPSELMRDEKVPAFHEGLKPLFRHALKRDIRASLLALLRSASTPMTPSRHTPLRLYLFRVGEICRNRPPAFILRSAATKNLQSLPQGGETQRGGLRNSPHQP